MDILEKIHLKFADEIGTEFEKDSVFRKAEKELNTFLTSTLTPEQFNDAEYLISTLTSEMERISVIFGMKLGAEITNELIKK